MISKRTLFIFVIILAIAELTTANREYQKDSNSSPRNQKRANEHKSIEHIKNWRRHRRNIPGYYALDKNVKPASKPKASQAVTNKADNNDGSNRNLKNGSSKPTAFKIGNFVAQTDPFGKKESKPIGRRPDSVDRKGENNYNKPNSNIKQPQASNNKENINDNKSASNRIVPASRSRRPESLNRNENNNHNQGNPAYNQIETPSKPTYSSRPTSTTSNQKENNNNSNRYNKPNSNNNIRNTDEFGRIKNNYNSKPASNRNIPVASNRLKNNDYNNLVNNIKRPDVSNKRVNNNYSKPVSRSRRPESSNRNRKNNNNNNKHSPAYNQIDAPNKAGSKPSSKPKASQPTPKKVKSKGASNGKHHHQTEPAFRIGSFLKYNNFFGSGKGSNTHKKHDNRRPDSLDRRENNRYKKPASDRRGSQEPNRQGNNGNLDRNIKPTDEYGRVHNNDQGKAASKSRRPEGLNRNKSNHLNKPTSKRIGSGASNRRQNNNNSNRYSKPVSKNRQPQSLNRKKNNKNKGIPSYKQLNVQNKPSSKPKASGVASDTEKNADKDVSNHNSKRAGSKPVFTLANFINHSDVFGKKGGN